MSEGGCFGDESCLFGETSDELLLVGGGSHCDAEAHSQCGFGGCSDEFTAADLPGAVFVEASE